MSSATGQIFDLYGSIGLEVDQSSWTKAQKRVYQFHRDMQRRLDNLDAPAMNIQTFGDAAKRTLAPLGLMASRLARVGAAAGAAAAIGGAAWGVKDALAFDQILTDIEQSSGGAVGSLAKLRKQMLGTSTSTGVAKEQVAAGAQAYITLTGDVKTAVSSMDLFARVARGQKTDMADVATVAATLGQQFKLSSDDFEQAFSILSFGAKAGAIEFRDMAGLMSSLGADFATFGGSTGKEGIATLGALFQVAKQGFGSASEAATGLEALMGSLQQNAAKLKKEGKIDVFESDGKTLKPVLTLLDEIMSKDFTGAELFDLFGRKESVKTLNVLMRQRALVDSIKRSAMGARDVQADFNRRMKAPSERVTTAWNAFKNKIAEAFTPERIEKFAFLFEAVLDSVINLGEGIKHWIIEPILDAIEAVKSFAGHVKDIGGGILDHMPGPAGALFGGPGGDIKDAIKNIQKRERNDDFAALHAGNQADQEARRANKAAGLGYTLASTVNVSVPPGTDANGVGRAAEAAVKRTFRELWDSKLREAAGG
jgi:TP901 family phage tail tape measure protein